MMPQHWLIALGAGLVSAVVFVSANTGPMPMRVALFALTPLAIALAGLGWGWRAGLIAGIAGTVLIGTLAGQFKPAAFYALSQAVPMAVLVYLAGLSRPITPVQATTPSSGPSQKQADLEWYPVGRLILWACGLGAAIAAAMIFAYGVADPEFAGQLEKQLAETIKANLSKMAGDVDVSDKDVAAMTKLAIAALPGGGAIAVAGSLLFSLWTAGRVAKASDQLERPWPDLAAFDFPTGTAIALVLAMAASFAPQPLQIIAAAVVGALLFAYLLLGLAVAHYTTRGNPWRPFALWALYIGLLFAQGVALLVILLGLSENFLRLRTKFGGPPDTPRTSSQSS